MPADAGRGRRRAVAEGGGRRPAIDVARVLALVIVVLGHLLLAVIDREGGEMRGANLVELRPGLAWVTVLAPMPVFFAAAGWANATATPRSSARRLATLVGAGAVVVVGWSAAVVVTVLVAGETGLAGRGARIATQPLWFLAAYVPFAANGAWLARVVAHRPAVRLAAILSVLAALDAARFGLGWSATIGWIGWIGFPLAWAVPWLTGCWWRARVENGGGERMAGAAAAVAAMVACWLLVRFAGYSPALIDAVPGARSNTTPPTLYTAVAAIGQVGTVMVLGSVLDVVGRRWQAFWDRAGTLAVGIYVWHLTALALCVGVVAAGLPVPRRLTTVWWLTRPVWWLAVVGVTATLLMVLEAVRTHIPVRPRRAPGVSGAGRGGRPAHRRPQPTRPSTIGAGLSLSTAGAALVGLDGPRSLPLAAACSALLVAGWWFLRPVPTGRPAAGPVRGRPTR
jgi:hypothetical protein